MYLTDRILYYGIMFVMHLVMRYARCIRYYALKVLFLMRKLNVDLKSTRRSGRKQFGMKMHILNILLH